MAVSPVQSKIGDPVFAAGICRLILSHFLLPPLDKNTGIDTERSAKRMRCDVQSIIMCQALVATLLSSPQSLLTINKNYKEWSTFCIYSRSWWPRILLYQFILLLHLTQSESLGNKIIIIGQELGHWIESSGSFQLKPNSGWRSSRDHWILMPNECTLVALTLWMTEWRGPLAFMLQSVFINSPTTSLKIRYPANLVITALLRVT